MNYSLFGCSRRNDVRGQQRDGIFEAPVLRPITLATGSLIGPGSTSLTLGTAGTPAGCEMYSPPSYRIPRSQASLSIPTLSQILDLSAAFTNTGSVITQIPLGGADFRLSLNGGGGNATFAVTSVPEPDTYGMLLAGLGLFAFIARRRGQKVA